MSIGPDHWAMAYIGQPWIRGEAECWHFAAKVWRDRFGLSVPLDIGSLGGLRAGRKALAGDPERLFWRTVTNPQEGDAVLMAKGQYPCHVGVCVAPQGVLHSVEGAGGLFTPLGRLAGMGYHIVGFYRRST
jgi:hypothetical protein